MGAWAKILNFGTLHKFGTGKARDFKFGIRIEYGMSHLMDDKIPLNWGHGVLGRNFEFWDPSLNLERVKLDILNLVYG